MKQLIIFEYYNLFFPNVNRIIQQKFCRNIGNPLCSLTPAQSISLKIQSYGGEIVKEAYFFAAFCSLVLQLLFYDKNVGTVPDTASLPRSPPHFPSQNGYPWQETTACVPHGQQIVCVHYRRSGNAPMETCQKNGLPDRQSHDSSDESPKIKYRSLIPETVRIRIIGAFHAMHSISAFVFSSHPHLHVWQKQRRGLPSRSPFAIVR